MTTTFRRRRWALRIHDLNDNELMLIVEVPSGGDGRVLAGIVGIPAVYMMPKEVAKLRHIYLEALAVALYDRGRW